MKLLEATCAKIAPLDSTAQAAAKARLDQLTMPHWALGRLMDLAVDLKVKVVPMFGLEVTTIEPLWRLVMTSWAIARP